MCSPARDESTGAVYTAWGHSMMVSPWGKVLAAADYKETVHVFLIHVQSISSPQCKLMPSSPT